MADRWTERWMRRFRCAGRGLWEMLRHEPSGRVHLAAGTGVILLGGFLRVSAMEWAILSLAMGLVLAAEGLNTSLERLADRVSGKEEEAIRQVKDLAAGGVLAAVLGAVAAGLCILAPPLWQRIRDWLPG